MKKAYFAAGCFWHVQEAFDAIKGVDTRVGFAGGYKSNPTYEEVCLGKTGHAETVEVEYDEKTITYKDLLKKFFHIHDPTQKNRQGFDIGSQYRSAIFYTDKEQKETAEKFMKVEQTRHEKEIATELSPFNNFYPAEDYHQKYFKKKQVC